MPAPSRFAPPAPYRSALAVLFAFATLLAPSRALAQNEIALENALPGNAAGEWDVAGAGDPSIQGFATDISVDQGGTVLFKIDTPSTNYRLDIYRLGYYGGLGARKVATVQPSAALPQSQPAPLTDPSTGLVDCGNWAVSASWAVPANAVSGVYVAKLVREDPEDGRASHVIFVVRDDDGGSDLLLQANDATWQAYNAYGGNSLYTGSPAGRAYKVSYNRPWQTRCCNFPGGAIVTWFFGAQYPMVRWLEANGYDVSYTTNTDTDRRGAEVLEHRVFVSVGHDEYWSGGARANVEAARNAGVNLAFFSGNEIFWKTRFEPSIDGSSTPYRTLVCYKETHAGAKIDPLPNVWTGTWRDPRFSPPADGGRPENALLGTIFTVNGIRNDAMEVPEADGKMRMWRNTSVATLAPGQVATFAAGTLGFEWDEDLDNGARPAGLFHLATATVSGVPLLQDYGSTYASGTATHHATMYKHASGARVFSAGTVQWSWGLDAVHDNPGPAADVRLQQATVNLFADLGVQPGTLQAGLVPASASTDATAPVSVIASPAAGANVSSGVSVVIAGTASDVGGRVGGIEVSTDGGATWHPAVGRESWSYAWTPTTVGATTIRTRAVDDSGNLETPGAGRTVNVQGAAPGVCPCTIFTSNGGAQANDNAAVEVGVRFRSDRAGFVTGLRFWKPGAATAGTHVGNLWTNAGTNLRSATFTNETASGWQTVSFGTGNAVPIAAGTTFVASVHFPVGAYAATNGAFATQGADNPPLHALPDGAGGFPNGVYSYGPGGFPTSTFQSTNYWVDVVFDTVATGGDTTPPVITNVAATPAGNGTSATVTWTTDEPATSRVDYGTSVGALGSSASSSALVSSHLLVLGGLTPSTTYFYRVTSADASLNGATSPSPPAAPLAFTTPAATCPADVTGADFSAGTFGTGTAPTESGDGEVSLAPAAGAEFGGGALPALWSGAAWSAGGVFAVAGGALAVDGARVNTDASFGAGRALEAVATFGGESFQHLGLVSNAAFDAPWAAFSTFTGGGLWARTSDGTNTPIAGSWFGAPHRWRIEWGASSVVFAIDGVTVATIPFATAGPLRPLVSDFAPGGNGVSVNWMRLSPFAPSGSYTSRVIDGGTLTGWGAMTWSTDTPAGTAVAMSVRRGNTPVPDGTWTAFAPVPASGATVGGASRYLQYRADLSTSDAGRAPALRDVSIACVPNPPLDADDPRAEAGSLRVSPNPFHASTTFRGVLPARVGDVHVALTIHDLQGRAVRTLLSGARPAGAFRVEWDARDDHGVPVVPGVYWWRLRAGGVAQEGRVAVLR